MTVRSSHTMHRIHGQRFLTVRRLTAINYVGYDGFLWLTIKLCRIWAQDYAETYGRFLMKFGMLIWNDDRKKPLNFGDDTVHIRRCWGLITQKLMDGF